jgi:hypothetical protein
MSGKTPWERWKAGERPLTAEEKRLFAQWDAAGRRP